MSGAKDPKLKLFELYLATAEKVSDRRAQANAWMLSVNAPSSASTATSRRTRRRRSAPPRRRCGSGPSRATLPPNMNNR